MTHESRRFLAGTAIALALAQAPAAQDAALRVEIGERVVSFTQAALDPEFARHPGALVAFRRNGKPLASREGPLQLILPSDRRHARWVRQLNSLTIHTAPGPR